jgi:hypothetical protein
MRYFRGTFLAAFIAAVVAGPALAVTVQTQSPEWSATYIAAYNPLWNGGVPYSGEMKLKFNHGIISGTYTATSVKPDPMYGRIISVTGTVSHGNINLDIGGMSGFTVRGTLEKDGTISGTATKKGHQYRFLAKIKSSP